MGFMPGMIGVGGYTNTQLEHLEESENVGQSLLERFPAFQAPHTLAFHVSHAKERGKSPERLRVISDLESRLEEFERKLQSAIDIGLDNRKLLEQMLEGGNPGVGAIHSLDQGRVQLVHPLLYSYQVLDDEVVVGIEEFGIYGVGATEAEAVSELQEELWDLVEDLEQTPPEKLGPRLIGTLRALRGRIQHNAVDA